MICSVCTHKIITKRSFYNLFQKECHHICEKCYRNAPIQYHFETIPINNSHVINHIYLSVGEISSYEAYMSFLAPFYKWVLKHQPLAYVLNFDEFNDRIHTQLELLNSNIYLISIKKREM